MKVAVGVILSSVLVTVTLPMAGSGPEQCPTELAQAKVALKSAQAALKKNPETAKGQQDVQARSRNQDVQAPRRQQDDALAVLK